MDLKAAGLEAPDLLPSSESINCLRFLSLSQLPAFFTPVLPDSAFRIVVNLIFYLPRFVISQGIKELF